MTCDDTAIIILLAGLVGCMGGVILGLCILTRVK